MKKMFYIFLITISTQYTFHSQPSITWQKVYNGYYGNFNYALAVCNADNNNFYIGGHIENDTLGRFNYLMKIDQWSDTIWTKKLHVNGAWEIDAMAMTNDSGLIFTGGADSIYTMRLDKNGNILWLKYYNGQSPYSINIKCLNDNNYISCGILGNTNIYSYLIKINSQGDQIWKKTYSYNNGLWLNSLDISNDGNYIVVGSTGTGQCIILKIDTSGNKINEQYYSIGPASSINFIKKTEYFYIISGSYRDTTSQTQDKHRPFIAKIDFALNMYYSKLFHYRNKETIISQSVINANRFVFTLYPYSTNITDTFYTRIMITDSMGNVMHEKLIFDPNNLNHLSYLSAEQPVSNGDILFVGDKYMQGYDNVYAIRSDSSLNFPNYYINIKNNNQIVPSDFELFQNYPNPFNPNTNIKYQITTPHNPPEGGKQVVKLIVYDILGREIAVLVNENLSPGTYELQWDGSKYPSGVYYYRLVTGDYQETKKMILLK